MIHFGKDTLVWNSCWSNISFSIAILKKINPTQGFTRIFWRVLLFTQNLDITTDGGALLVKILFLSMVLDIFFSAGTLSFYDTLGCVIMFRRSKTTLNPNLSLPAMGSVSRPLWSWPRLFFMLMFFFSRRPQVATLIFIWSALGIFPCCRKIFLWRLSFGFLVINGFRNFIWIILLWRDTWCASFLPQRTGAPVAPAARPYRAEHHL